MIIVVAALLLLLIVIGGFVFVCYDYVQQMERWERYGCTGQWDKPPRRKD